MCIRDSPIAPHQSEGAKTTPEVVLLLFGALCVYFTVRVLVELLQPCAPPTFKSGGRARAPPEYMALAPIISSGHKDCPVSYLHACFHTFMLICLLTCNMHNGMFAV